MAQLSQLLRSPATEAHVPTKPSIWKPSVAPAPPRRTPAYTARLRRLMEHFKKQHPLCAGCQAVGRITATQVADHIVPARGDDRLLWDTANLQPLCSRHHNIVKQRLELMFAKSEIASDALNITSPLAIKLTRRLLEPGGD